MKEQYVREYSHQLGRDMEFMVYGHAGKPVLAFPSQNGRFFDFKNNGMVDCVAHLINQGRIQIFACDSIDTESWSDEHGDGRHRAEMQERYFHYISDELAPRILEINQNGNGGSRASGILTTGCSLGGTHALNTMLRNPYTFDATIALSGLYDAKYFFGGYFDDLVYNNSPVDYINGMPNDHPYVARYRACKIVTCVGQGAWEDEMLPSNYRMKELFGDKGIDAWCDFWGHDVAHDWPWWRVQLPYFLEKLA